MGVSEDIPSFGGLTMIRNIAFWVVYLGVYVVERPIPESKGGEQKHRWYYL